MPCSRSAREIGATLRSWTATRPSSGPGAWIPTPPGFANPQTPFVQFVTPFGYDDPARFRPKAPPALDSRTYTVDYNESKDLGRATETSRTAEQSATALFWSPSASALWSANVRSLASSMDLLTAARFEAIGIAAVVNALIACWDAKYTYMFWRPVTAIRAGDTDGNSATEPDQAWEPFIATPSHPEYPAAHTTVGASVLGFYTVWFGTDQFQPPLAFKGGAGAVRYYASVRQIHAEEGNARVWGGMHWRHSTEVGTAVGSKIGNYTATHLLTSRGTGARMEGVEAVSEGQVASR
jgi:PAP2 superfamily